MAVLLTWSAVRFHRALVTGRERDWLVFSAAVTAMVPMRALYHPVWLLLVFAGAAWTLRWQRRHLSTLARPALAGLLVIAAVLAKSAVVFGQLTLSSFGGMNLSRVVLDRMDESQRAAWVAEGTLSQWALTGAFRELAAYTPPPRVESTGVPLLDRPSRRMAR